MVISAYHINNVLRVYGDQFCKSMIYSRSEGADTNTPERISFSVKRRRETIIDDIISKIIVRITQFGPHDNVGKEVFKKLEYKHGNPMTINKDHNNKLIFKESMEMVKP